MAVNYDRLFHMMIDRKLSNANLMKMCSFSANIITRLKKDEDILWKVLKRFAAP